MNDTGSRGDNNRLTMPGFRPELAGDDLDDRMKPPPTSVYPSGNNGLYPSLPRTEDAVSPSSPRSPAPAAVAPSSLPDGHPDQQQQASKLSRSESEEIIQNLKLGMLTKWRLSVMSPEEREAFLIEIVQKEKRRRHEKPLSSELQLELVVAALVTFLPAND